MYSYLLHNSDAVGDIFTKLHTNIKHHETFWSDFFVIMLANSISPELFPLTAEKSYSTCQASSLIFTLALNEHLLVNMSGRILISSPPLITTSFMLLPKDDHAERLHCSPVEGWEGE